MKKGNRQVILAHRPVGECFATVGVVKDAETGRTLAVTGEVPYGFAGAAIQKAEVLAARKGWSVVRYGG